MVPLYSTHKELRVYYSFARGEAKCFGEVATYRPYGNFYSRGYSSGNFRGRKWVHSRPDKMLSHHGPNSIDALEVLQNEWVGRLERLIEKKTQLRRMARFLNDDSDSDFDVSGSEWFDQPFDIGPLFAVKKREIIPFVEVDMLGNVPTMNFYRRISKEWVAPDMTWVDSQGLYMAREFVDNFDG